MLSLSKFLTCRLACVGLAGLKHLIRVDYGVLACCLQLDS